MAMMVLLFSLFVAALVGPGCANNFLRASSAKHVDRHGHMNKASLRASLLEASEGALGENSTARRLNKLEAWLSPMFGALPKNKYGNLEPATVRYALHRLFVQRHAWYIEGLEPDSGSYNTSSPTDVLPLTHLQKLFEDRLKHHGFNLHDTAVFAATLEHLIHKEAVDLTKEAYSFNNYSQATLLSQFQADRVIETYMKVYIMGDEAAGTSDEEFELMYPGWKETKVFLREMRNSVVKADGDQSKSVGKRTFTLGLVTRVIEEVAENFGVFQNSECMQMKAELLQYGNRDTGHVPLASFYTAALEHGSQQFTETKDYLRQLGALDESDTQHPYVIVPNYILSKTNCISTSNLHSTCCINECENLLGHLETLIASPEAEPSLIAKLIADLPSSTTQGSRKLSPPLVFRLNEIAQFHGGTVPLHGRLFAQWMHHAYPRECPYPHVSGTSNPQTPDEWMEENDQKSVQASPWEMRKTVDDAKNYTNARRDLQWSSDEELFVPRAVVAPTSCIWRLGRCAFYLFAAVLAVVKCSSIFSECPILAKRSKGNQNTYPTLLSHHCWPTKIEKHLV